ncbi:MAG: sulfatase-like hydrolase/transferase [Bacteroidales bacterium]|nr:sulfatase-like hydrolase/transferase [Bacteroidales bacterium]
MNNENLKNSCQRLLPFILGMTSSIFFYSAEAQTKKNLLFIITDQMRYDALSITGNSVIKTPNLDRLAQRGAYFKNAYSPCAVSGPARSCMLTGCRVESTGVNSNAQTYDYHDTPVMEMPTFDEILAQNGYHCEYYGKWHALTSHADVYQNPTRASQSGASAFGAEGQSYFFRDYLSQLGNIPEPQSGQFVEGISKYPYVASPLDRYFGMTYQELMQAGLKHSQPDQHGKLLLEREHTMTAFQARQALDALERLKDKTFSLTCSFHFPHSPMVVPEPYFGMYPVEQMQPPVSINDDMTNSPYRTSNSRTSRTEYADPNKIKYMISDYYGIITEIDDWVGKILNKLDELGITDNTMIIFTSDHGEMLGAHGMREKNVFYEESAHIPLFISLPNEIESETTVCGYVSLVDLFPTILDYLQIPGQESDGVSLRGMIQGTDAVHGQYVVTEWDRPNTPNLMIVKDGWKLMIPQTIQSTVINALYDLNTDPHEMNNLLGSNPNRANYLAKAEELRASILEWLVKKNSIHYYSVSQRDLLNGGRPTGNNASFVSLSLPESQPGETVTVQVTMKNSGTSSWSKTGRYKLARLSETLNLQWGIFQVELDENEIIPPGSSKTFTFNMQVPIVDGIYNYEWQMIQEGEEWFGSKTAKQIVIGTPVLYLDDCDGLTGWNSSQTLTLNGVEQKQGLSCLEFEGSTTDEYKKAFATSFNSKVDAENGVLQFWYYVSDPSVLSSNNQVELGSGGKADVNEYSWKLSGLQTGWNLVNLPFSDAAIIGSPNIQSIDWFRLYSKKTGDVKSRIDAIRILDIVATDMDNCEVASSNNKLVVYPNPVSGKWLHLLWDEHDFPGEIEVSIFDVTGKSVFMKRYTYLPQLLIDVSSLDRNALYVLTIKGGRKTESVKFMTSM